MAGKKGATYASAGVNIDNATEAVKRMKKYVSSTKTKGSVSELGLFGGMFQVPKGYKEPILVASTDGVGTKLKLAYLSGKHDTVGQDLVNHCVNDILVQGAKPLFFLDYIGVGKLEPDVIVGIVKGLAKACKENGCALVGGETAEMPGLYKPGEYDLASCIVGIVEKKKIIDGSKIKPGDVAIALPSSGLHTNGYSLAMKLIGKPKGATLTKLMAVHKSYLNPVMKLMDKVNVKGMAHITGGGTIENIPRILPKGCSVEIDKKTWKVPSIFHLIQKKGNVATREMFRTFNMGIGLVVIVSSKDSKKTLNELKKAGEKAWLVGRVVKGQRTVKLV